MGHPGRAADLVVAAAARQRRPAGQHALDADGRAVRPPGQGDGVPLIFCTAGERKHLIAGQYLETHLVTTGVFLILAMKAPAAV